MPCRCWPDKLPGGHAESVARIAIARGERKAREEALIRRVVVAALGLALMWSAAAHAQGYPARPVKLGVTFAAGGADDLFGRAFASALGNELGQQVFVEVHAGA